MLHTPVGSIKVLDGKTSSMRKSERNGITRGDQKDPHSHAVPYISSAFH